jgi:hypothetical protein
MPVVIAGLKELRAALRDAELAAPKEVTAALKIGAAEVTARARELAPKKSGKMAASLRPFATQRSAGVRSNHPGAGVQDWATTYYRHAKGSAGVGHADRALKRHIALGHVSASDAGMQKVTLVNVSSKGPSGDRFAYKAIDELGPKLVEETFDRIVEILKCHGWFG